MANDCIPFKRDGYDITCMVTAAVTGKRCVVVSATRSSGPALSATAEGSVYKVATAGAGARPLGVAAWDQPTVNGFVNVIRKGIVPITAGAAITAGQEVMSDASGKVVPWTSAVNEANKKVGLAMADAALNADAEILLYT